MNKKFFTVNFHSFVDIITNSSTSIFVCDDSRPELVIESLLRELIQVYNNAVPRSEWLVDEDSSFYVKRVTPENVKEIVNDLYYDIDKSTRNKKEKEMIGKIVIRGASDNSIPGCLFDFIEEVFCAERMFLG